MRVLKTHLKPLGVRYTNPESLRSLKDATDEEWEEIWRTVESLIDDSPEANPKRIMQDMLDHVADSLGLDITPENIRCGLDNECDWLRYFRTYMPLTDIEQIRMKIVELAQNSGENPLGKKTYSRIDALVKEYSQIHGMWTIGGQFTDETSLFNGNMTNLVFDTLHPVRVASVSFWKRTIEQNENKIIRERKRIVYLSVMTGELRISSENGRYTLKWTKL